MGEKDGVSAPPSRRPFVAVRPAIPGFLVDPEKAPLKTFLDRTGLAQGRMFHDALWGWEILGGAKQSAAYNREEQPPPPGQIVQLTGKRGRPRTVKRLGADDLHGVDHG